MGRRGGKAVQYKCPTRVLVFPAVSVFRTLSPTVWSLCKFLKFQSIVLYDVYRFACFLAIFRDSDSLKCCACVVLSLLV